MWSGSFLFSKSNGKTFSPSSATTTANQQILSPFGIPCAVPSNVHRASGGVVPPALLEEKRVPKFYKDCLAVCGATTSSQLPNTGLVYNLMVASQLPRDDLSDIWIMVNRTIPGQLTRPEFFSCLALIALAQKGDNISALCDVTTLPIPHLQTFTEGGMEKVSTQKNNNSKNSKTVIETTDLNMRTKPSAIQSSRKEMRDNIVDFGGVKGSSNNSNKFIPTDLINSNSHVKGAKNDETTLVDLIDFYSSDSTSQASVEKKQESISYELLNLDLSLPPNTSAESASKLTPQEFDPYAVLREGPPEDEYLKTWQRIIHEGVKILNASITLLEKKPSTSEEISQTETGIKFIQSNRAIADVINRVALSLFKHRQNQKDLIESAKNSLILWKKLIQKPYISKALNDTEHDTSFSLNGIAGFSAIYPKEPLFCGICIHQISFDDSAFLQFVGGHYHSPCANFWANQIDVCLPKLEKL